MVTSINNPQTMGLGFRDASSVPRYNTPTGQTTPQQDVAAASGYERGTQNPLNMMKILPGGNFLANAMNIGENDTFGNAYTADSSGNVFAPNSSGINRAYDPITGRVVPGVAGSFGSGVSTIKDSYGKLRDAGEGVIGSALGSYDNSIYRHMDENPGMSKTAARTARLRGDGSPIRSTAGQITQNTRLGPDNNPGVLNSSELDNNPNAEGVSISPYQLGFDGSRSTTVNSTTGNWGSGAGDIVGLSGNQLGVLSPNYRDAQGKMQKTGTNITYDNSGNYTGDRVNLQSPTGTVTSIRDSKTGEMINATRMSPLLQQELDRRAGNDRDENHTIVEGKRLTNDKQRSAAKRMNEFGDIDQPTQDDEGGGGSTGGK
tara:strand:+ start:486 stop:1604 length:1119 start_codon:yes stop_codon:yes gene_type:complete